jgi:hypothetical protein
MLCFYFTLTIIIGMHDLKQQMNKSKSRDNAYKDYYEFMTKVCSNLFWPLSEICTLVAVCGFFCLLKKIQRITKTGKDFDADCERMRKNMANLSKILKFFLVLSTYLVIYTIISNIQARITASLEDGENSKKKVCNAITHNVYVDFALWLLKRLAEFSAWRIPIMYILWPDKKKGAY